MELQKIIDILDEYIRNFADVGDDPDYSVEVNLFDYGFLDSLGAMNVIAFVEDKFGVEITQKDITLYPMNTVTEIAEVVEEKLK